MSVKKIEIMMMLSLDEECLYKHGKSMYYQGQVSPPEGELFVPGPPVRPDTAADRR